MHAHRQFRAGRADHRRWPARDREAHRRTRARRWRDRARSSATRRARARSPAVRCRLVRRRQRARASHAVDRAPQRSSSFATLLLYFRIVRLRPRTTRITRNTFSELPPRTPRITRKAFGTLRSRTSSLYRLNQYCPRAPGWRVAGARRRRSTRTGGPVDSVRAPAGCHATGPGWVPAPVVIQSISRTRRINRTTLLVAVLALLTACSEPPQKEIDQAQSAVDAARAARADAYAPEEYTAAAAALQRARQAVDERD